MLHFNVTVALQGQNKEVEDQQKEIGPCTENKRHIQAYQVFFKARIIKLEITSDIFKQKMDEITDCLLLSGFSKTFVFFINFVAFLKN